MHNRRRLRAGRGLLVAVVVGAALLAGGFGLRLGPSGLGNATPVHADFSFSFGG